MRTRVALSVVLAIVAVLACRTAPIHNITRSNVPPGLSADQVGEVIEYAAARRGWSLEQAGAGHKIASMRVRDRHLAVVDVTYDSGWFSIEYRDSENLLSDGVRIHRNYNGWVIKLERTIRKELLRAAGRPQVRIQRNPAR